MCADWSIIKERIFDLKFLVGTTFCCQPIVGRKTDVIVATDPFSFAVDCIGVDICEMNFRVGSR